MNSLRGNMENNVMEENIIEYSVLSDIMDNRSRNMSCEELIKTHKDLCNKMFYNADDLLVNCGSYFYDIGLAMTIDEGFKGLLKDEFFKSAYVSNYVKEGIRKLLEEKNVTGKVINLLKSDKLLNDMSYSELMLIFSTMIKNNVSSYTFVQTLFRLDGEGVKKLVLRKELRGKLLRYLLNSCGLSDRAEYYSGRGVNIGDLDANNLLRIHAKLKRINPNYTVAFYDLVNAMPTLGATEFIRSFQVFARNGFKFSKENITSSNYSLDGLYGDERNLVAAITVFTALSSNGSDRYNRQFTRMIKDEYQKNVVWEVEIRRAMTDPNANVDEMIKYLEERERERECFEIFDCDTSKTLK